MKQWQDAAAGKVTNRIVSRGGAYRERHFAAGIAIVWTAVILVVIVGLVGLACDYARLHLVAHQLQAASEGASMAAARLIRASQAEARLAAIKTAKANTAGGSDVDLIDNPTNDPAGDIVLGRWRRDTKTFIPTLASPNAVKVVARRTDGSPDGELPLIFGPVFAKHLASVERTTIAMITGGTGAGLICLDPTRDQALDFRGTVNLDVNGGDIQVNSSSSDAITGSGTERNLVVNAPAIDVVGEMEDNIGLAGEYFPGSPALPDPLAFLPEPTWVTSPQPPAPIGGVSQPGYYPQGIRMTSGSMTLAPGIYILDGAGLEVTGGSFYAHGVMFYIVSGHVDIGGNVVTDITSPNPDNPELTYPSEEQLTLAGIYEGVTFFQARDNSSESTFIGTSDMSIEGALYFPAARMELGGTCDSLGSMLVAGSMWFHGGSVLTINYDGRFRAQGNDVFIVW